MMERNYYCLRQNDGENMDQESMYKFIIKTRIVICPWGLTGRCKDNVRNGDYNETFVLSPEKQSKSQDRKFVKEIKIGDIVLIPFLKTNRCILGEISSDVIYDMNTDYSIHYGRGKELVEYHSDELEKCQPIGRFIKIIHPNYEINNKRHLGRLSLCKSKHVEKIIDTVFIVAAFLLIELAYKTGYTQ